MVEKKSTNNIFKERLDENKSLPKAQQFEHIVNSEVIKDAVPYKRTTKRLVRIETGLCPECECETYCVDYFRGERVCPKCGYVFVGTVFDRPRFKPVKEPDKNISYSYDDKQFLQKKNHHFVTEVKEWKRRQLIREIDVVSSALTLNIRTKKYILEVFEKTKPKKLHSTASITTIIAGVARYMMKNKEHLNLVALRYDRGIFEETLTRHDYNIIERNIVRIFGDIYAYKPKEKKKKKRRKNKKHGSYKTVRAKKTHRINRKVSRKRSTNQ